MAQQTKKIVIFAIVLAMAMPAFASAAWWENVNWQDVWGKIFPVGQNKNVCTMDTRQCPDGSYVGRSGPKCQFKPCPAQGKCQSDSDCKSIKCIKAPCPQQKCINSKCQSGLSWDIIYPFYEGAKWGNSTPKRMGMPAQKSILSGFDISGNGEVATKADAQKFFDYYAGKLKDAGWVQENALDADGVTGSQTGFKKDNDYMVLNYKITGGKNPAKSKNKPLEISCPCKVRYSIFAGTAESIQKKSK